MTSRRLRVAALADVAPQVRGITLVGADGTPLPPFAPGSHVVVTAGGVSNAYSLTGDGIAPTDYRISVLRRGAGGGSDRLHELRPGDALDVEGPVSTFAPDLRASRLLLVAAGIGVTPILSHLRAAVVWGRDVEVVLGHRPERPAHVEDVRALAAGRLVETHGRTALRSAVLSAVRRQPWGTHLYVCGPPGVLDLVTGAARDAGWPAARVHLERFEPADAGPRRPFTARLVRSGRTVRVGPEHTLLDRLEAEGVEVAHLCRHGVCGRCRVVVRAGRVEHRDLVLSDAERDRHDVLLACVSRAQGEELEVDL